MDFGVVFGCDDVEVEVFVTYVTVADHGGVESREAFASLLDEAVEVVNGDSEIVFKTPSSF